MIIIESLREPTPEECEANAKLMLGGESYTAAWYPQRGGYVAKCLIRHVDAEDCCYDLYVWHDGEFPFSGEGETDAQPVGLHHCDGNQFIAFGELLNSLDRRGIIENGTP